MQALRSKDKDVITLYLTPDEASSLARGLKGQIKSMHEWLIEGKDIPGVCGLSSDGFRIEIGLDVEGLKDEEESRLWKILLDIYGEVYHECNIPLIEPESSAIVRSAWNHIDNLEYEAAYQAFMKVVPDDPRLNQARKLLDILQPKGSG